MLSRAGAAAAGLVVAGALTQRDIRQAKAITDTSSNENPAVLGTNTYVGPGVKGVNTFSGPGVHGEGLYGLTGTSDPEDGASGVGIWGNHTGIGPGVMGDSKGGNAIHGRGFERTGAGVYGEHFGSGYGGQFKGGKAQLRLVPGSTEGRPGGAHSKGERYIWA